jgi:hypothetical protein
MQRCLRRAALHNCTWLGRHSPLQRRGVCTAPPQSSKDREARLQWVAPENRKDVARVVEVAERCVDRWETAFTDFLSPPVAADAMSALTGMADLTAIAWGGYPQAERCRCALPAAAAGWRPGGAAPAAAALELLGRRRARRIALGREEVLAAAQQDPSQLGGVAALQVRRAA